LDLAKGKKHKRETATGGNRQIRTRGPGKAGEKMGGGNFEDDERGINGGIGNRYWKKVKH